MKITKNQLVIFGKDCINSYHGKQGTEDYSAYQKYQWFKFGFDEGYFGIIRDQFHIVIQGTDKPPEWWHKIYGNFNFALMPLTSEHLGGNKQIKVHSGFLKSYLTGRDYLLGLCKDRKKIVIKGHSRGGGIATLFARDLKYCAVKNWQQEIDVTLITGGSPKVYNKAGADEFNRSGIACIRLQYRNDLVCKVPPLFYEHVGFQVLLGKPFINLPFGNPFDHYPEKYLAGVKLLPEEIF